MTLHDLKKNHAHGTSLEMTDALIPEKHSDNNNKESAKKSVVGFCYLFFNSYN